MLINDDSISVEEKIKQLIEFEEEKRRELEKKKKELEKKKKELEELEKRGAQEIEEARKEIEEKIEELSLEEKKRFEELEELRRRREEERSLEEAIEEEEREAQVQEVPEQRAYGEVIEEILRGTPTFYDITNYNVMNRLEHIARAAGERPISDDERKFIELVQYHAERMQRNKFYREKDTSDYMRRELEKIDLINKEIRKREEKPGDYQP